MRNTLFLFCSILLTLQAKSQAPYTIFDGSKMDLDGEWNFVMGSFLSHEEADTISYSTTIEVPSTWNDIIWKGEAVGSYGYATYTKKIIYQGDKEHTSLALEVPEVSMAYKLYADDELLGQVGIPGENEYVSRPKVDYQLFDFEIARGDTVTLIFHISNFSNAAGGLWYAPTIDYKDEFEKNVNINRSLKLIILGCILIGGLFQLSIFIIKPTEKFAIYFFLVCLSISMLLLTRGYMTLIDLFPDASWITLKKTLYLAIVLIAPANALFLREMYPDFYHKRLIYTIAWLSLPLSLFILLAPARISYHLIPYLHIYDVLIGIYLFVSLIRVALSQKFGAKFLIVGYVSAFLAVLHDVLSANYIITGYSFELTPLGVALYIIQLMFILAFRYLFFLKGKEQLSIHLKKVNNELEQTIERRTKTLRDNKAIIEKQNAELQQAMKEKDHLIAVVAHDLKAPLSSIMGISEMMGTGLEGQNAEFNEMIKKVTVDGRAMIENLTELKVYEQDDYEVQSSFFSLSDFFKRKKLAFETASNKKGITFNAVLDTNKSMISTDENVLGRVIDNLVSNALKFTPKGGEVKFIMSHQTKSLRIIVSDNGPGFSDRDMKKVFQKFQRLSARPTAGESSAGLGLSIVKTLVERIGGTIDLKSEQGAGAKFTVSIPL